MLDSYIYMFLLYLPVFFLMRHKGWTGRWYQSLSGFLCVMIPFSPLLLLVPSFTELIEMLTIFFSLSMLGFAVGWTFWWLAVRENGPNT